MTLQPKWLRRLWAKVEVRREDECWPWTASTGSHGYGQFNCGNNDIQLAHRLVYEDRVGPIPDGFEIDHLCHNSDVACDGGSDCPHRRCCNPRHLEAKRPGVNKAAADEPRERGKFTTHCPRGHSYEQHGGWFVRGARGGSHRRNRTGKRERYCLACNRECREARD